MKSPAFEHSYTQLPEPYFTTLNPTPVATPVAIQLNDQLAEFLNIDLGWFRSRDAVEMLAGNATVPGSFAAKYGGHQFGNWNPQLGDGRAITLGELIAQDGERYDVQLKGAGPTPYSRGGDGRAPLGPVLREYIVSEAMFALGVPTTRALAAVTTGEPVFRRVAEPGAVLARVAKSHIRIGTFQFFAAHSPPETFDALVEYTIARHYPELSHADLPALEFLRAVSKRLASLVAKWHGLGFVHGVMNTDNMLVSGETIDYGPCAFIDNFSFDRVFSSIDTYGRYAYRNQPAIAQWNIAQLATSLVMHLAVRIDDDIEKGKKKAVDAVAEVIEQFASIVETEMANVFAAKVGLPVEHAEVANEFLELMEKTGSDFTTTFRQLIGGGESLPESFTEWRNAWLALNPNTNLAEANPYIIPRNHQIAKAIANAESGDFAHFHDLVDALRTPYDNNAQTELFAAPPAEGEVVRETFCGT